LAAIELSTDIGGGPIPRLLAAKERQQVERTDICTALR